MNKITDIFRLEKWRVVRITLIAVVLILAGCQSQAVPSTATPTEIPATATLMPSPTIQAPQIGAIVDPDVSPIAEISSWSAPTGAESVVLDGEPLPVFAESYDLLGLKNSVGPAEFHSNGLTGNEYQWIFTATDKDGNVIWAFNAEGLPFEYPMYFTPMINEAGQTNRYDVSQTTPQGEPIKYEPVPNSREADVVFVGDILPVLVKNRVVLPGGEEVFLRYFDKLTGEWVFNDQLVIKDAAGSPLEWKITNRGFVYVENGKPMLLGTDGVKEIGDISTEVIFSNGNDALAIFNELFKAEIENQEQLHNDLLLDGYPSDYNYKLSIDEAWFHTGEKGNVMLEITGIPVAFAKVATPMDSSEYPQIGLAYLKVYGYEELFPVVLGAFDEAGKFHSLVDSALQYPRKTTNTTDCSDNDCTIAILTDQSWNALQRLVMGNIMNFDTLFALSPDKQSSYELVIYGENPFSVSLTSFWQKLAKFIARGQGGAGNTYLEGDGPTAQAGALLSELNKGFEGESGLLGLVVYSQFKVIQFK